MEETLLSVMYEVPSRKDVGKVVITPAVVNKEEAPTYIPRTAGGPKRAAKGEKISEEKTA
jgi:ATP-dependent Clp protease ATP-binding subunit ClpX